MINTFELQYQILQYFFYLLQNLLLNFYGLNIKKAWAGFQENKAFNRQISQQISQNPAIPIPYGANIYKGFWANFGEKLLSKGFGTGKFASGASKTIFGKLATSLTGVEAGAGTAAGALASLAGVLGIVAAVAAAIGIAIKLYDINNISTEEAKKNASNLAEAKNTAKENRDSYNEQIKNYKELQKTLKNTHDQSYRDLLKTQKKTGR